MSLFLILASIVLLLQSQYRGLMVDIAERVDDGECSTVVAHVLRNGAVKLNSEPDVKRNGLANRLHEIFNTRAERLLFLKADPDVPFRDVAEVIEIAEGEVQHVAILTPGVENEPGYCLTIKPTPALRF